MPCGRCGHKSALKPNLLHKFGSHCSHCYLINFVMYAIPQFLSDFQKIGLFGILELFARSLYIFQWPLGLCLAILKEKAISIVVNCVGCVCMFTIFSYNSQWIFIKIRFPESTWYCPGFWRKKSGKIRIPGKNRTQKFSGFFQK